MGKKVYFLDSIKQSDGSYNNTYGVDDINAIVSNLVGAGVAPFPSADTYDVSELNSLTSALVAEGTSLDGLKVSFNDNKIHIAQGIGYFENGATIVVDSEGEELEYSVAETLYVYAEYDQALNVCGFYTSESEPISSTGIYVLVLATISADGTVIDKRNIAQSKIATMGKNVTKTDVILEKDGENCTTYTTGTIVHETKFDISKYNAVYFTGREYAYSDSEYQINKVINLSELLFGEEILIFSRKRTNYNYYYRLCCKYSSGKIQVYVPNEYNDETMHLNYLNAIFY